MVDGKYVFSRNVRLTRHPTKNTFGIQLQSPGEALRTNSIGCLIKAVQPSCTAPAGAVQPGDRILSVNGTATLEWSYHQIIEFMKKFKILVLSLRRELPEAEVAKAKAAKASPKPKTGTRAAEGAGGTGAKESEQSSAEGSGETKKKGEASKLSDDEADGKSLTSTKTTPDVQSTVAGLATTKAPPPAAADGSNEAAAPDQTVMPAIPVPTPKPLSRPAERTKRLAAYEKVKDKTKPAPEFGEGWRVLEVTRKCGQRPGRTDSYWFSPKERFRLRSKAEVRLFQLALQGTAPPREDEAWAVMKGNASASRSAPGGAAAAPPSSSSSSNIGAAEDGPAKPPAGSNSEANASSNPDPIAAAVHPPEVGTATSGTIAVQTDPKMPSGGQENGCGDGVGDAKKSNGSALDKASEPKPKKKRGRPPKKKQEAEDSAAAEKEGPKTKKWKTKKKKKGAGGASTSSGAGSDPAIFDIAVGFPGEDAKPDLTFTSEKGKGETDVDRVVPEAEHPAPAAAAPDPPAAPPGRGGHVGPAAVSGGRWQGNHRGASQQPTSIGTRQEGAGLFSSNTVRVHCGPDRGWQGCRRDRRK